MENEKNILPQYTLLTYPNKKLTTVCASVDTIMEDDRYAINEMKRICAESNGFALAANQIGYMRRIVVFAPYRERADWIVMINPKWYTTEEFMDLPDNFTEGCLSFPSIRLPTPRYEKVQVEYMDEHSNNVVMQADGIMAIGIQHECEHLDGRTFIDNLSSFRKKRIIDKLKKSKI